jgi:very-short-patch-repair endonuclease
LKLAIEIDGSSHDGEAAKVNDEIRQERLESLGVRFLRFTDADVQRNMEMVVGSIDLWIADSIKYNHRHHCSNKQQLDLVDASGDI